MTEDEAHERIQQTIYQYISEQKTIAVNEAIAGDWERYDWLAGRINRILWFAGDAGD